jgi:hypothetical protein
VTALKTERTRILSVLVTTVALMSACGGGSSGNADVAPPPPGPPPSVERTLSPTVADPNAEQVFSPDVVINPSPSVAAKGRLFIFLPGSKGPATSYRLILRAGAARGYHTLGLDYENNDVVGLLCLNDSDCYGNVRLEVITGVDSSPLVNVNDANSIVTRVTKALSYLAANSPDEGWGQFLNADGKVDWSKVVVGGHSQGGGHAGVMAKLFALNRACYFASPADATGSPPVPANWMSAPGGQTPGSAQYGIVHELDPLVPLTDLEVIWPTLGMPGSPTSVDGQSPPYGGAHQLTTTVTPVDGDITFSPYHGVTVYDPDVPLQGGVPVFDAVWGYMCFP